MTHSTCNGLTLRAADAVLNKFGRLDILVNGAAGNFLCAATDLSYNAFKTGTHAQTIVWHTRSSA